MKLPGNAMYRVVFNEPIPLTKATPIFAWLKENNWDSTTNRQFKNSKLSALVFDEANQAMLFKLRWIGML